MGCRATRSRWPLASRVADYFDALSHAPSYWPAVPVSEVVDLVRRGRGWITLRHDVINAFLTQRDTAWGTPLAMRKLAAELSPDDLNRTASA